MQPNEVGIKAARLYEMLKEGKKITTSGDLKIRHRYDWNDPNSGFSTSEKTSFHDIIYFKANPQMNRIIGLLDNGKEVDVNIDILDIAHRSFTEYISDRAPTSWKDIFNAKNMSTCTYSEAIRAAEKVGYNYLSFNGLIYAVRDRNMMFPLQKAENI